MNPIYNPASYVHQIKVQSESKHEQLTLEKLEQQALTRSPNFMHKNGQIYASLPGEPYIAVTVSPFNPKFESQIEPGIYPLVKTLLDKNYLTVSSCIGHNLIDLASTVIIVFGSSKYADKFIADFGQMEYVKLTKFNSVANNRQIWNNDKWFYRPMTEVEKSNIKEEIEDVNRLFKRSYKEICYVEIRLYGDEPKIWNLLGWYHFIKEIRKNKSHRLNLICERIKQIDHYEL